MSSEDSDRGPSRRHERTERGNRDGEHERDRDRPRESGKDRSKGRDRDRDSERRRERHRDHDDRRSRHGESHRDRDGRDGRDGRHDRDRRDRDGRDGRRDDRDNGRSHDSKKRRREDTDEKDRTERSERRRRALRDDDDHVQKKEHQDLRLKGPLPDQAAEFAMAEGGEPPPPPKEKPNWGSTGALAAASNAVSQADGSVIVLKYSEPPNARKPSPRDQWSLFVFKDGAIVDTIDLNARSCWLVGREDKVVDIVAAHPSVSGQHAAVQFRYIERRNEFGDRIGRVKPYVIDLASGNGTQLNGDALETQRYVELRHKDMVKFGHSTREYVVMLAPRE